MQQNLADPATGTQQERRHCSTSILLFAPEPDQHVCACGPDWVADQRPKQKRDDLWAQWSAPC